MNQKLVNTNIKCDMRAVLSNNVGKKKCATSLCIKNLVQTNEVLKWTAALITVFGQEQA